MFGLYRTVDPNIKLNFKEQLNISQWFSFSNKSEKASKSEKVSKVAQQQTQPVATQVANVDPVNTDPEYAKPATTEADQPPTFDNVRGTNTAQAEQAAATRQPVVAAAQSTIPPEEKQLSRVPGKTTVLVLSPHGNKVSDDSNSSVNPQNLSTSPAVLNSGQSNHDTVALLSDSDGSNGEQYIEPTNNGASLQTTTEPEPEKARVSIHEVQNGENLTIIAAKLGTTVERLKQINRLPDDRILAGQNLIYEN